MHRPGRAQGRLDIVQLARAVEALGCGEILLGYIDNDGQNDGYDLHMTRSVHGAVGIPVIASSARAAQSTLRRCSRCPRRRRASPRPSSTRTLTVGDVKAHVAASVRPTAGQGAMADLGGGGGGAAQWKWMPRWSPPR